MRDRSTALTNRTRQPRVARTTITPATSEPDEFLRRARMADAAKSLSANGARMAQRSHSRTLAAAIEQLVIAALPHVDNGLTAPMVEVQLHTPGADGELIASFQLPKQIADEVTVAVRTATARVAALSVEHSRTADTAPAPVRALSILPGGVA